MRNFMKSTFVWQFTIGFALGALGVATLTPVDTVADMAPVAAQQQQAR